MTNCDFKKLTGTPFATKEHKNNQGERLKSKIKQKYDLRETFTPFTFLKVSQAFRDMKPGEILQVTGDDPKIRKEIFKVLKTINYTVVDTEEDDNFYCVCLRKEK
jgi:TusA-related sulfurtransferase